MIFGIGNDICDVRRIALAQQRRGTDFAQKVLGPSEWQVYLQRQQRHAGRATRYLATRFSAKEAVSKALGLGIRLPMRWQDCEILNHTSGKPYVQLHGALAEFAQSHGLSLHISITDESDYAASFCVAEQHQKD